MNRVLEVNAADRLVRVQPGIRLHDLAERLSREGLALENQGDVDVQTLAGALATATHGTGLRFANLSSQLVACRLAGAGGELHEIDASDEESLLAARVSLGALGIMSEVTIRVVPSFRLRRVEEPRRVADVLERLQQSAEAHDHFELFAFPYSGRCLTLESERTDEPARPMPRWREVLLDDVVANGVFGLAVRLGRRFPSLAPRIGSAVGGLLQASERLDDSHRVFANTRRVHFTEMEYALPRDAAADALLRVTELIERRRLPVNFPIELRFVAGDEGFLSTAHGRDTAYIAVHQYVGMEYEGFFRAAEAIFDEYGGRPHWGKRHYQSAATLASRYPAWERFQRVRARFDPGGLFTNDYLKRVLGPVQVPAAA